MGEKTMIKPLEYSEPNENYTEEIIKVMKRTYFENKGELFDSIMGYLAEDRIFNQLLLEFSEDNAYYSETAIMTYHLLNTIFPKLDVSAKNFEYAVNKYKKITADKAVYSKKENLENLLKNNNFLEEIRNNLEQEFDLCEELNIDIVNNKKELKDALNSLKNFDELNFL
jgi:hypothetical protein